MTLRRDSLAGRPNRVTLALGGVLALAAVGVRLLRASLQGGGQWVFADALLDALFWLLASGSAVVTAGAFELWPMRNSPSVVSRGLVTGALIGLGVVVGTAVPDWFLFATDYRSSPVVQALSLGWSAFLDFAALVGAFVVALSLFGWVSLRTTRSSEHGHSAGRSGRQADG